MKLIDEDNKKYDDIKKINEMLLFIIANVVIILAGLMFTIYILGYCDQLQKHLLDYKDIDYANDTPIIDDNNNYKMISSYAEFEKIISKINCISTEDTKEIQEIKEEVNQEFFNNKYIIIQDSNTENFITSYDLEKIYFKNNVLKMDLLSHQTKFTNDNINGTLSIVSLRKGKDIKKVETKYVFQNAYVVRLFLNLISFMIILLFSSIIFKKKKKSFIYFISLILYIGVKFLIEIVPIL